MKPAGTLISDVQAPELRNECCGSHPACGLLLRQPKLMKANNHHHYYLHGCQMAEKVDLLSLVPRMEQRLMIQKRHCHLKANPEWSKDGPVTLWWWPVPAWDSGAHD